MSRLALRVLLACCAVAATACQADQLQFRNDHRLSFLTPRSRARVTTPLTIRWTMTGFEATGLDGSTDPGRGVFAVFVDRAPMAVGKTLKSLAGDDKGCKRDPLCPDATYLANRNVYVTTETSLRLNVLPNVGTGRGDEQHFVNIVLLDGTGRRLRESAWYRPFTMQRRPGG